jgi:hypothetical protein
MNTLEIISQIVIFVTGPLAIWLSQTRDPEKQRWSSILGVFGQPFWLYAAFAACQWGIFVADIIYTYMWWTGVRNYWLRPESSHLETK